MSPLAGLSIFNTCQSQGLTSLATRLGPSGANSFLPTIETLTRGQVSLVRGVRYRLPLFRTCWAAIFVRSLPLSIFFVKWANFVAGLRPAGF